LDRQQFALAITELIALTHKMIAISVDELKTKARCKSLVDQVREFQQQFVNNRWMWHEQVTRMLLSFASVARLVEHLQWVDEARRVDDEAEFDDDDTTQLNDVSRSVSRSATLTRDFDDEFDDDDDESPRLAGASVAAVAAAAAAPESDFRIRSPLRPITLNQMRQRISQRAAQRASTLAVSWSTADITPQRNSDNNNDDDDDEDEEDENHVENDDVTVVITRSAPKDGSGATPTKTASPAATSQVVVDSNNNDDDDDDDEEDTEEFEVQAPAVAEKPARQSPTVVVAVAAPAVATSTVSTSTSTSSLLTLPSDCSDITRMRWSGASSRSSGELSGGALKRSSSVTHQRPVVAAPSNRNRREKRGRTLSLAALDLSRSQSADALLERRSASPSPREPLQLQAPAAAAAAAAAAVAPSRQLLTASGPVALSGAAASLRRAHTAADSRVLCRLCEERVPSFALALHSVHCVAAQRARANASESDDRLRRLETTLLRRHERELPRRPCDRKVSLLVLDELSRCVHACRAIDIERSSAERRLARLTDRVEQLTATNSSGSENEAENGELHRHSQTLQRALLSKAQSVINRHAEIAAAFAQLPRRARKRHGKAARRRQQEVGVKDFQLVKPISKGAYGRVFLTQKSTTGDLYALKVMSKRDVRAKKQAGHIKSERNIAAHTACPYLVRFYYAFQTRINLYMVMEYLPGGDLASLLRALGCFDVDMARAYIAETVEALEYLHHAGVVHRDIKPDNLLLTAQGHLKLTDFGLSSYGLLPKAPINALSASPSTPIIARTGAAAAGAGYASSAENSPVADRSSDLLACTPPDASAMPPPQQPGAGDFVGTPDYLAPEVILGLGHSFTVDWWAVGVLVFEMLTGCPPFNADSAHAVFARILDGRIPWPGERSGDDAASTSDDDDDDDVEIPPEARDLIVRMLDANPKKRLGAGGADEVKEHAFFRGIEWDELLEHDGPFVPQLDTPDDTSYFEKRGNDDDYTIRMIANELGGFAATSPYMKSAAAATANESAPAAAVVQRASSEFGGDSAVTREPSPVLAGGAARPIVPPLPLHLTRRLRSMSATMAALDDTVCALPAGRRRSFVAKLDNATPRSQSVSRASSRINTARSTARDSAPTSARDSVDHDVDVALQSADSDDAEESSSSTTSEEEAADGGEESGADENEPTQVIRVPDSSMEGELSSPANARLSMGGGGGDFDDDPDFHNFSFKNLPHLEALNRQLIADEFAQSQAQRRRPMSLIMRNTPPVAPSLSRLAVGRSPRFASDMTLDAPRRAASTPHRHRKVGNGADSDDDDDDNHNNDDDDDDDEEADASDDEHDSPCDASGKPMSRSTPVQIKRRTRRRRSNQAKVGADIGDNERNKLASPAMPSPIKHANTPTRTFGSPINPNSPASPRSNNSTAPTSAAKHVSSPSKRLFSGRRMSRPAAALSPR
jgi:serine/threonine protein kinase